MKPANGGRMVRWMALALALAMTGMAAADQTAATTKPASPDQPETKEQKDARMAWWRAAKFGMFIHWGVYSVPAGMYEGKKVGGLGEWIMAGAKIPVAKYAQFATQFDPEKFDAEKWVSLAKHAGVKYIVITSKHHDGFAMFHSLASKFNIYDATPFKRDPLAELAAACQKEGLKLGFYYSQNQDWSHPGGGSLVGHWDKAAQDGDYTKYIDDIAVPQVRELLTNYGQFPAVIWWDTSGKMDRANADKLYKLVKELKPDVIMNNRLGGGYKGDTETPEQHIPAGGYKDRDWESCMTINNTWGYKSYDNNWKSTETLLFNLVDIASKGGNYLLNVGPTSEGVIPDPCVQRLNEIGDWMAINGEAIYGTSPSCFGAEYGKGTKVKDGYGKVRDSNSGKDWRCTTKPGKIYIHFFNWPGTQFEVSGMKEKATRAYLLIDRDHALNVAQDGDKLTVSSMPETAPGKIATVLCIETAPN